MMFRNNFISEECIHVQIGASGGLAPMSSMGSSADVALEVAL